MKVLKKRRRNLGFGVACAERMQRMVLAEDSALVPASEIGVATELCNQPTKEQKNFFLFWGFEEK